MIKSEKLQNTSMRARVAIVVDAMSHYRESFYELLRRRLECEQIELTLVCGAASNRHNISGSVEWAKEVPLKYYSKFVVMNAMKFTQDADLIIMPQVIKHLYIYPYLLGRLFRTRKIAFWGHGKMFSAAPQSRYLTGFKNWLSRQCDWWFAYTDLSADVVRNEIHFPQNRITVVNNTVDTKNLTARRAELTEEELMQYREKLGLNSTNVGIFVGGMYHNKDHTKRLPFLVSSCIEIRKIIPDFEMIFVGGGPEQYVIENAVKEYPWMHYVGIQKGVQAVPYWALAKVCLNPGLVGLSILDGFAVGVPLVTSDLPYHSPEIGYLRSGENGLMVDDFNDPSVFAKHAASVLQNDELRKHFIQQGLETVSKLTNEAMVENFCHGILQCLSLQKIHHGQV